MIIARGGMGSWKNDLLGKNLFLTQRVKKNRPNIQQPGKKKNLAGANIFIGIFQIFFSFTQNKKERNFFCWLGWYTIGMN